MKKNLNKCRCNESLDIMCSNCVRRETIERIAASVADSLLGAQGVRLVIERKGKPFDESTNRISDGGYIKSAIESVVKKIVSRNV
jgi:hypothetical protein